MTRACRACALASLLGLLVAEARRPDQLRITTRSSSSYAAFLASTGASWAVLPASHQPPRRSELGSFSGSFTSRPRILPPWSVTRPTRRAHSTPPLYALDVNLALYDLQIWAKGVVDTQVRVFRDRWITTLADSSSERARSRSHRP